MSTEPKWTKGPWAFGDKCKHSHGIEITHSGNEPGDISGVLARVYARPSWLIEGEANAHLIAAAPELYAELEKMVESFDRTQNGHYMFNSARAALAKARGESFDAKA